MRVSFVLEVALLLLKLPVFLRIRRLQPRAAVRHSRNWRARFLPHVTRGAAAGVLDVPRPAKCSARSRSTKASNTCGRKRVYIWKDSEGIMASLKSCDVRGAHRVAHCGERRGTVLSFPEAFGYVMADLQQE